MYVNKREDQRTYNSKNDMQFTSRSSFRFVILLLLRQKTNETTAQLKIIESMYEQYQDKESEEIYSFCNVFFSIGSQIFYQIEKKTQNFFFT